MVFLLVSSCKKFYIYKNILNVLHLVVPSSYLLVLSSTDFSFRKGESLSLKQEVTRGHKSNFFQTNGLALRVFFGLTGANFVKFTIIYLMLLKYYWLFFFFFFFFFLRTSDSKPLCSNFIINNNTIIQYISIFI